MGENSHIQWTDHTFNPWIICHPVSPGCLNCYAALLASRFGWGEYKKETPRKRTSAANWRQPVKWNREAVVAAANFRRPRVFCASIADWLDDEVPHEWLADLLCLIWDTGNLDWQLLTKRPENFAPRLKRIYDKTKMPFVGQWLDGQPPENVWLGTSVEDQKRADERIPHLLKIPAKVRFLSVEPLLGEVNLELWAIAPRNHRLVGTPELPAFSRLDWVIIGGESGPKARPCSIEWIRDIVHQCKSAGVPAFVKQLGAKPFDDDSEMSFFPTGSERLKDKKGGEMSEWPEDLRIREFPT